MHDAGADPALDGAVIRHLGLAILPVLLDTFLPALLRAAQPELLQIPPLPPHEPTGMYVYVIIRSREEHYLLHKPC